MESSSESSSPLRGRDFVESLAELAFVERKLEGDFAGRFQERFAIAMKLHQVHERADAVLGGGINRDGGGIESLHAVGTAGPPIQAASTGLLVRLAASAMAVADGPGSVMACGVRTARTASTFGSCSAAVAAST